MLVVWEFYLFWATSLCCSLILKTVLIKHIPSFLHYHLRQCTDKKHKILVNITWIGIFLQVFKYFKYVPCLQIHQIIIAYIVYFSDDYVNNVTLGHILELLTFCVEHHTYHIKNYVISKDLLRRVLVLMKSQHKFLVLSKFTSSTKLLCFQCSNVPTTMSIL